MVEVKRIVLKIGTSVLLDETSVSAAPKAEGFARQVKAVRDMGIEVIIVSSGAIACGMEQSGLKKKPKEIARKQALASVGQIVLMKM